MGTVRHVLAAAALAAFLAVAPAAAADEYTCRVDGQGEPSPPIAAIATDLSTDEETGRVELRLFGECLIERGGIRTTETVHMNASLDYVNSLCGTMQWVGPFSIAFQQGEIITGNVDASFRAGVGDLEFTRVESDRGLVGGSGLGAAHVRALSGDCVLRPADRLGFIAGFHLRAMPTF